jgi:hypothetical protein
VTVFEDGHLVREYSLDEVRHNAEIDFERREREARGEA